MCTSRGSLEKRTKRRCREESETNSKKLASVTVEEGMSVICRVDQQAGDRKEFMMQVEAEGCLGAGALLPGPVYSLKASLD